MLDCTDQTRMLSHETQIMVQRCFVRLYTMQSLIPAVVASLQFITALLQLQRKQIMLKK